MFKISGTVICLKKTLWLSETVPFVDTFWGKHCGMQQRFVSLVSFMIDRNPGCSGMRKRWNVSLNKILYTMCIQVGDNFCASTAKLQKHVETTVTANRTLLLKSHHSPLISFSLCACFYFYSPLPILLPSPTAVWRPSLGG